MTDDYRTSDKLEAEETARELPVVWLLLFVGLIIWGIYYIYSYMPVTTGWTQTQAIEQTEK